MRVRHLDFTRDQFSKLRPSLGRIRTGRSVDLRTKLYGGIERNQISGEAFNQVLLPYKNSIDPVLFDLELKEKERISPYSIQLPWVKRRGTVSEYYVSQNQKFLPDEVSLEYAIGKTCSLMRKGILQPLKPKEAFERLPKDTNWGLPFYQRGSLCAEETFKLFNQYYNDKDYDSIFQFPCTLGWRGQPSGDSIPKQRVVWMFPHIVSILEKMFVDPVTKVTKGLSPFCAWNHLDVVDKHISSAINEFVKLDGDRVLLSVDFSGFDKSIHFKLVTLAFRVLKWWYAPRYHSILNRIEYYFTNCPIVTPDGLYTGPHGVPSGSGFTNLIDSIVNYIAYHYLCHRLGISENRCFVQGDDGVYVLIFKHNSLTEKEILNNIEDILSELNLSVNAEKQFVSSVLAGVWTINQNVVANGKIAIHYLQRLHITTYSIGGVYHGIRSLMRCLNGALSHESLTPNWNKWLESTRFVMQLDNCLYHPYIRDFISWFRRGDSLNLGKVVGGTGNLFKVAGGSKVILSELRLTSFPYHMLSVDPTTLSVNLRIAALID